MRSRFLASGLSGIVLLLGTSADALERQRIRLPDEGADWAAGVSCSVRYYNVCNGWAWAWTDFPVIDNRIGVVFDPCGDLPVTLQTTRLHFLSFGETHGYLDYAEVSVHTLDENNCPTQELAVQPLRGSWGPLHRYVTKTWNLTVDAPFAVIVSNRAYNSHQDVVMPRIVTDAPHILPCHPHDGPSHSYEWGDGESPLCPPTLIHEEADLIWNAQFVDNVSVDATSWGRVKGMYR